jgi:hypothetical protein
MRTRPIRPALTTATRVACALVLASCGLLDPESGNQSGQLAEARAQWALRSIDSYDFVLRRSCYCGGGTEPARVQVRDGVRTSVVYVEDGTTVPPLFAPLYLTVPELFDFIEDAIDRGAHSIQVRYHATLGYPTSIQVDYLEAAVDEEMAFTATDLVPLD